MAHNVEKISIWILEALEEEWRREPDILKCRTEGVVFGEVMAKHNLENADISRAIMFMVAPNRQYLKIVDRQDGRAILPSDNGLAILGRIALCRIEEQEKKKWSRADKISLASLVIGIVLFFLGYFLGDHNAKKSDDKLLPQQTNSMSTKLP